MTAKNTPARNMTAHVMAEAPAMPAVMRIERSQLSLVKTLPIHRGTKTPVINRMAWPISNQSGLSCGAVGSAMNRSPTVAGSSRQNTNKQQNKLDKKTRRKPRQLPMLPIVNPPRQMPMYARGASNSTMTNGATNPEGLWASSGDVNMGK